MDGFLAFSARVKELVDSILGWIASAMLLVLTLFSLLEIIRRYIFGVVFEWGHTASCFILQQTYGNQENRNIDRSF